MSPLKRTHYPIPDIIQQALPERGWVERYESRPEYQQNNDIGCITRTKRVKTQQKRLAQMPEKLEGGELYMKMVYQTRNDKS